MSILYVNTITPNSGDTVTVSGSLTTTGKLTIGDASTDTVTFEAEISSSLIPDIGATYALGTMANSWGSAHIHGLAHIHTASINVVSSSLLPDATATYNLGTMAKAWGSAHIHGLGHIHTASINVVSSSLIPDGDDAYDLGSSAKQWKDLYVDGTAYIDNFDSIVTTTITASSDISSSGTISANSIQSDLTGSVYSLTDVNVTAGDDINLTAEDDIVISTADEIQLTTTSTDGHITLTSAHTSGVAFHIDANASADAEVQIDAGVLDIDVTGAATLDASSISLNAPVTASNNISSSGTIISNKLLLDGSIEWATETANEVRVRGSAGNLQIMSGSTVGMTINPGLGHITSSGAISASGNLIVGGTSTLNGDVTIPSPTKLYFEGTSGLHIYSEGTSTDENQIILAKTNNLRILNQAHGKDIIFGTEDGSGTAKTPLTLSGSGDAAFGGGVTVAGNLTSTTGVQSSAVAVTATDAGAAIPAGTAVALVNADSDANHIVILPAPVVGNIITIIENGTTGYELRTSTPASIGINGGTGTNAESAIAGATTYIRCVCVSSTSWIATQFAADGTESKVEAAA